MKRRNVEGNHPFAQFVAEQYDIYELGGLLLDKNWNFTAAVEAFDLEPEENRNHLSHLLDSNGFTKALYMDSVFAEKLDIPFYIISLMLKLNRIFMYMRYVPIIGTVNYYA